MALSSKSLAFGRLGLFETKIELFVSSNKWEKKSERKRAKEKPAEGEVVSCGDGARKDSGELIDMAVSTGDKVLFGKWSGTEVTVDGEELLIMKESDILGVLS